MPLLSCAQVTNDDTVRILVPQEPAYPRSRLHVPVTFRSNPNYPLVSFSVKVRVKAGLKVVGAQLTPGTGWLINSEVSPKHTAATITAYMDSDVAPADRGLVGASQEVFVVVLEVDEQAAEVSDAGRVVWTVTYSSTEPGYQNDKDFGFDKDLKKSKAVDNSKLTSRINVQKDEVQTVVGVVKKSSLLNTAVISAKQVHQPMRVFAVSESGRAGDVTLQASCHSHDESIVKVSPSCTSVYLDGSEIRGSTNATVAIKYGTRQGQATFVVWMPRLPLELQMSDSKLSQIKGWKTPHLRKGPHGHNHIQSDQGRRRGRRRIPRDSPDEAELGCKLRYQQAGVTVLTRFISSDHDSGRESTLLSRSVTPSAKSDRGYVTGDF